MIFFILLFRQTFELSDNKNHNFLSKNSKPKTQALVQAVNYNKETFTDPSDFFDNRVTIISCKFLNCFSDEIMEGHYGGAIYFIYCNSKITDSLFDNCAASQGGAIYSDNTQIAIKGTNFTNNQALEAGGAVVLYQCTDFKITDGFSMYNDAMYHGCFDIHESNGTVLSHKFISNTAKIDCAAVSVYESQAIIENCYFIQNEAEFYPGALQVEEGEGVMQTSCEVRNCFFLENEAGGEPISVHLTGNVTGSFTDCVFDVDIKEAVLEFKSPNFKFVRIKVDPKMRNPFESIPQNKQEIIEYSQTFDHSKSDYVATLFIVIIPIYVGIVFFLLIKD